MNNSPFMKVSFPDGSMVKVKKGSSLLEILEKSKKKFSLPIVAAKINNRLTNLRHKISIDSKVEFIDCAHPEGFRVYQSSLSYLLGMAVYRLFPEATLKIEHSLSKGLYCEIHGDVTLTPGTLKQLEGEMRELIKRDFSIEKEKTYLDEAKVFFKKTGQIDKIRLFQYSNPHTVNMYHCDGYKNYSDCPLVPHTSLLDLFSLEFYPPGFIMIMPEPYTECDIETKKPVLPDFIEQPKLFRVFQEHELWLRILGLEDVGALNDRVVKNSYEEIIRISEALHEKKIAQLADQTAHSKIILIAGPSSSGKTTFAKRLSDQLRVNGLDPMVISLDDYFLDREKTPKDENGDYDFESLYALDIQLLKKHFKALLNGKEIKLPKYNFHTGKQILGFKKVKPNAHTVLIFEGIHAINPELIRNLPLERISRVYVSPLTTLSMDNHNRIPTTDVRLLRRIVRDYLFRGYDALETLQRWQSVRRGETQYIFPYQKDSDYFFNSSLVYELAVLKRYAEPLLLRISTEHPEYSEARRLLKFLSYFQDISPDHVPYTSILREFIGKSGFKY